MATVLLKKRFVKWKFKCNNAQQQLEKKELARNLLTYYLKGYANALRLDNRRYPKFRFLITNEQFLPGPNRNREFIYTATLERKSDPGATFPGPDSTINPTKPPKPGP